MVVTELCLKTTRRMFFSMVILLCHNNHMTITRIDAVEKLYYWDKNKFLIKSTQRLQYPP